MPPKRKTPQAVEVLDQIEEENEERLLMDANNNTEMEGSGEDDVTTVNSSSEKESSLSTSSQRKIGNPVPVYERSRWPQWRNQFFTDWRFNGDQITASCKMCPGNNCHSGHKSSFSNFKKHARNVHSKSWNEYDKKPASLGSAKSGTLERFGCSTMNAARKRHLDLKLTQAIVEESLPFNLVKKSSIREWVQVRIELKLLLNYTSINCFHN